MQPSPKVTLPLMTASWQMTVLGAPPRDDRPPLAEVRPEVRPSPRAEVLPDASAVPLADVRPPVAAAVAVASAAVFFSAAWPSSSGS